MSLYFFILYYNVFVFFQKQTTQKAGGRLTVTPSSYLKFFLLIKQLLIERIAFKAHSLLSKNVAPPKKGFRTHYGAKISGALITFGIKQPNKSEKKHITELYAAIAGNYAAITQFYAVVLRLFFFVFFVFFLKYHWISNNLAMQHFS